MSKTSRLGPFANNKINEVVSDRLPNKEKVIVFGASALSAAGIVTGALGDTYMLFTTEAGAGSIGMSISVSASVAPFCVVGVAVVAVLLGAYIVYNYYHDYVSVAERFLKKIHESKARQKQLNDELQCHITRYFISILQAYLSCLFFEEEDRAQALHALRLELSNYFSPSFLEKTELFVMGLKERKEAIYFALKTKMLTAPLLAIATNDESLQSVYNTYCEEVHHKFKSLQPKPVMKPSFKSALGDGSIVLFDMYGNILSGLWFALMMAMAFVAISTVPLVGWMAFGGALLLCASLGLIFSYYKYKNVCRHARLENAEAKEDALRKQDHLIQHELNQVNEVILENSTDLHLRHHQTSAVIVAKQPLPSEPVPTMSSYNDEFVKTCNVS